jgi:hypothetical protein
MNERQERVSRSARLLLASLLILLAGISGFIIFSGKSRTPQGPPDQTGPEPGPPRAPGGAGWAAGNGPGAGIGGGGGEIPALPVVDPGARVPPSALHEPPGQTPVREQDPQVMAMSLEYGSLRGQPMARLRD